MLQPKLRSVFPLENKMLLLEYETGERKVFDVKPYIKGDWFGKLSDERTFKTVHLAGLSVAWEGGQDIAPHELYDQSSPANDVVTHGLAPVPNLQE
jgi:hypothetical protein